MYNYPKNHIKFITDELAPDKGERLEQVTEAKRRSLNNLDQENGNAENNLEPPQGAQSVHSEHLDGALNDELIVAGIFLLLAFQSLWLLDENVKCNFGSISRDIRQCFSYYQEKEKTSLPQPAQKIEPAKLEASKSGNI